MDCDRDAMPTRLGSMCPAPPSRQPMAKPATFFAIFAHMYPAAIHDCPARQFKQLSLEVKLRERCVPPIKNIGITNQRLLACIVQCLPSVASDFGARGAIVGNRSDMRPCIARQASRDIGAGQLGHPNWPVLSCWSQLRDPELNSRHVRAEIDTHD